MSVCVISGLVYNGASPAPGVLVRYRTLAPVDGAIHVVVSAQDTRTASDGTYSLTLTQGATCRIEIPLCGIDKLGTVPSTATATADSVLSTWTDWDANGSSSIDPARQVGWPWSWFGWWY